jgi:aminoglycoside phosphotransferase (APT) family kinase protein
MNRSTKETTIIKLRPNANNIEWVGSGDVSDVAVVDGREAFRFPKTVTGRELLQFEFALLQKLQGKLSVTIPNPIEIAQDGSYSICSFIPGKSLNSDAELWKLPAAKQQAIGKMIGTTIKELSVALNNDELSELLGKKAPAAGWDSWYAKAYKQAAETNNPYSRIYRDYYKRLIDLHPQGFDSGNCIVSDDFHAGNIILDENHNVAGLIDFTEVGFGNINRELRTVYRMGTQVFNSALEEIGDYLGKIDTEVVKKGAAIHEIAALIEREAQNPPSDFSRKRIAIARQYLKHWADEGEIPQI